MNTIKVTLNQQNSEHVSDLIRTTGKSAELIVNDVLARCLEETDKDEHRKFLEWREALLQIEGMWKDRDDLPDFEEQRKSWDRSQASRD